jgi:tRNA A-37 threonylcarbamoyl transferase component Bud32/uncharacterized membrane protein YeaQ/YmgE (transglycosylase-associated protein family)
MEIIGVIVAGIILGLLGNIVALSTRNNLPLWLTIICGLSGAIIGEFSYYSRFVNHNSGIDWIRWLITVVAAAILMVIANAIVARSRDKRYPAKATALSRRINLPLWLMIICCLSGTIIGEFSYSSRFINHTPGIDWIRWLITVVAAAILLVIANAIVARSRANGYPAKATALSTRINLPLWLTIICGLSGDIIGELSYYSRFVNKTPGIDWIRWLITVVAAAILMIIAKTIVARTRPEATADAVESLRQGQRLSSSDSTSDDEIEDRSPRGRISPVIPEADILAPVHQLEWRANTESGTEEPGTVLNHKPQLIFLSYRRKDTAVYAILLQTLLRTRFPTTEVFLDLDSIEAGLPFDEVIRDALNSSAVLIALIGRQWTTIVDEDGRRRLDDPDDYVRYEIQTALKRRLRVIPVLVDGAKPLRREDLPSQLQGFSRLEALELNIDRNPYDADRLLGIIERVLAAAPSREKGGYERPIHGLEVEQARQAAEEKRKRPAELVVVGGRYELGELLGRGGMAEVRRAVDHRLGRSVAVKQLRTDLARDPTFQAQFRREAQSAAGLNHPTIVAVYDTGEEIDPLTGVGIPYIVMELVEGPTLRDVLSDGRKILPERALEVTQGVLDALSYLHTAGIVHRDLKPANVMLTPNGGVKVMDFGIARAVADTSDTMTQTAAVIGTAQYLSPEQARGETVDARSDLYSAGCLLYELLLGRPPFVGDSPVSVAYQHVREAPVPPSRLDRELTPEIDAVVLKALAKDPDDRYQSAGVMKADIARLLYSGLSL